MNRDEYERDLKRRQQEHLANVRGEQSWRQCMHDQCPECLGTGIKRTGGFCMHAIACPCQKCSPSCLAT